MRGLQAQFSIGCMSELVGFRTPSISKDAYASLTTDIDDTTPTMYRAQVIDVSAKEAPTDTPQDQVTQLIKVTMRSLGSSNNPTQEMTLVWRSNDYDILNITMTQRDRFIMIEARNRPTRT